MSEASSAAGSFSLGPGDGHGTTNRRTGAVVGTLLVVLGGVGVVLAAGHPFAGSAGPQTPKAFGQFGTDLLQAILNLILGAVALAAAAAGTHRSRLANRVVGGICLLIGVYGIAALKTSFDLLATDDKANDVHLVLGFLLLVAGIVGDHQRSTGHGRKYRTVSHDGIGAAAAAQHRNDQEQR